MIERLTQTFPVGDFTCQMIYADNGTSGIGGIVVEWSPHKPSRGELGEDGMADYRKGRYEFFKALTKELGASIGIVET